MKLANASMVLCLMLILPSIAAHAQESVEPDDLLDRINSALDLDFKQRDSIKSAIETYAQVVDALPQDPNQTQQRETQVGQLSTKLDQQINGFLTADQQERWKTAKKDILPQEGGRQREGREGNEAGENEAAEHGG